MLELSGIDANVGVVSPSLELTECDFAGVDASMELTGFDVLTSDGPSCNRDGLARAEKKCRMRKIVEFLN